MGSKEKPLAILCLVMVQKAQVVVSEETIAQLLNWRSEWMHYFGALSALLFALACFFI